MGYFDNTKHLSFWLCNMKQLNYRHFNANSKKITATVNFIQKETKTDPKRPILFCLVLKKFTAIFRLFSMISEDFGRLPKILNNYRQFPKTTEDFRTEIRKFSTMFSSFYSHVKDIEDIIWPRVDTKFLLEC